MITIDNIAKVRKVIAHAKKSGKIIGFVPTMGALHQGHISLVKNAKKDCDFTVVSIFVNPKQFGPNEDYAKYPKVFRKDKELLKKEGVDLIFFPAVIQMYPGNFSTYVDEIDLSQVLCGKSRPVYFKGVCTVVTKLFNIIQPDVVYFGAKDYQQAKVIEKMSTDLNFPIKIKICPTVREPNGLAMSSRNSYLNNEQRKNATCLHSALSLAQMLIKNGERDAKKVLAAMNELINVTGGTKIDYIKIVNADTLRDIQRIKGKILVVLAVFTGTTRLIDNKELYVKK